MKHVGLTSPPFLYAPQNTYYKTGSPFTRGFKRAFTTKDLLPNPTHDPPPPPQITPPSKTPGGFFASGFKRTFKLKDFGDTIPGHGGVTDRFDCQMIMAMFAYLYYWTFVAKSEPNLGAWGTQETAAKKGRKDRGKGKEARKSKCRVTDRFDCQKIMATFAHPSYWALPQKSEPNVGAWRKGRGEDQSRHEGDGMMVTVLVIM